MPRRKTITDLAVLDSALRVMFRTSPSNFTLADVAAEAGVASATLVQRFGSKRNLVIRAIERDNAQFVRTLIAAPAMTGAEAVINVFLALTPDLGPEDESLADQVMWLREDFRDPQLNSLARERFRVLRSAVIARLPPLPVPGAVAARLLEAQWQGALNQWGFFKEGRRADYVQRSLREWFTLTGAPGRRL